MRSILVALVMLYVLHETTPAQEGVNEEVEGVPRAQHDEESTTDSNADESVPEIVVLGTLEQDGVPTVPFNAIGSRDVLGPEEVARIGARDINDLVQYLPTVSTRPYNGGEAAAPSFSIRGLPDDGLTEYLLILVDGVPANPLPYGWTALSFFPLMTEQVRAVDLIRGGHSVRYSPNSVGGVLNFITAPIPKSPTFDLRTTLGENGYSSTLISAGDTIGNFGYLATIGDRSGDGYREDGEFSQRTADIKLRWSSSAQAWTEARVSYMDDDHQAPGGLTLAEYDQDRFANSRPRNSFEGSRWVANIVHHVENGVGHTESFAWVSQTKRGLDAQRPHFGGPATYLRWTDDSFVAAAGLRGQNKINDDHTIYWGTRLQGEYLPSWKITTEPFAGGAQTKTRDSRYKTIALSAHIDDTFTPTEDLSITAGLRAEWVPITEGEDSVLAGEFDDDFFDVLPGFGMSYAVADSVMLFGNYQRSFRAPQVWGYDLNAGAAAQEVGFENGDSFEFGVRVLGPGGTAGSVTAWRTDFDDVGVFYTGSYENIGRIVADGFDFDLTWEVGESISSLEGLSARASWTIQDSELKEGPNAGNETPYAWGNKGAVSLQYLTTSNLRLTLGGIFVDQSFADDANTLAQSADGTLGVNPSRTTWDAQVEKSWGFGNGLLSASLGATNLFDKEWFVHSRGGFFGGGKVAGPHRQLYFRISASF